MSENGGILTKGFTEEEMGTKAIGFFKDLLVLQSKYIDVVRENWGFEKDDDTSSVMCPLSSTAVHSGYSLRSLNASVAVLEREHGRVRCTRVVRLVLGLVSKY